MDRLILAPMEGLAARIRGERGKRGCNADWLALLPLIADFWSQVQTKLLPQHAPGRLKQWLRLLGRNYPEAELLYRNIRELRSASEVSLALEPKTIPMNLAAA